MTENEKRRRSSGMGRRGFLKESFRLGLVSAFGAAALGSAGRRAFASAPEGADGIAVAAGPDYGRDTMKAVELIGGMGRFVSKGASVAVLANSQSRHPGTFTGP